MHILTATYSCSLQWARSLQRACSYMHMVCRRRSSSLCQLRLKASQNHPHTGRGKGMKGMDFEPGALKMLIGPGFGACLHARGCNSHQLRAPARTVKRKSKHEIPQLPHTHKVGQFRMPILCARIFSAKKSMRLLYNTYRYVFKEGIGQPYTHSTTFRCTGLQSLAANVRPRSLQGPCICFMLQVADTVDFAHKGELHWLSQVPSGIGGTTGPPKQDACSSQPPATTEAAVPYDACI
eukprot:scaffold10853_cov18-Tisochrysis_lutea.AAC.1